MINEISVGPQNAGDAARVTARGGRTGETIVGQAHGRFYEAVSRGKVFIGANVAATPVTTQAGLSATTPALTLYNPVGSGYNLVLQTVCIDVTTSPAAASGFMLAFNAANAAAPSSVTAGTLQNALLGSSATGVGLCYRIATLAAAPIAIRYLGGTTGAAAIGGVQLIDRVEGEIIIAPGVALSVQATSAAAILANFVWEECAI